MTNSPAKKTTRRIAILTTTALAGASLLVAAPRPNFGTPFRDAYPGTLTDDNVEVTGTNCQVCHTGLTGGDGWNAYGWKMREFMEAGSDIDTALVQVEAFDSDGDPTGSSNLEEIQNDGQPGWTPGPVNTHFFKNGTTTPGQMPPAGFEGELDPIGTRYCSPAVVNSTGDPGHISVIGSNVVADDDLTLIAVDLPTNSNIGYFIMGTGTNTFIPPGAIGPICVAPGIKRYLPPVNNTNQLPGGFTRDVDTSGPISGQITVGSTWNFQAWHRDSMAGTSNLTDAFSITFQ